MKRFWREATVVKIDAGFAVLLDGRPVRTPERAALAVPTRRLAEAIAAEWTAPGDTVEPRAMVLTGLANAAIDRIAPDPAAFAAGLARLGEGDLLYYRAGRPARLVARQAAAWDPLLDWARRRFAADFVIGSGVMPLAQPQATIVALASGLPLDNPFRLAALSSMASAGGSLIAALAVAENAVPVDAAWDAVTIDDRFQAEEWGDDAEAERALAARRGDFAAGAKLVALLG